MSIVFSIKCYLFFKMLIACNGSQALKPHHADCLLWRLAGVAPWVYSLLQWVCIGRTIVLCVQDSWFCTGTHLELETELAGPVWDHRLHVLVPVCDWTELRKTIPHSRQSVWGDAPLPSSRRVPFTRRKQRGLENANHVLPRLDPKLRTGIDYSMSRWYENAGILVIPPHFIWIVLSLNLLCRRVE